MTARPIALIKSYRPEVDGLRAIAVVSVMLFHAGFAWARGGYLGVDIFYVISGYLITQVIVSDCAVGSFSLARFYMRRIRRIAPALLLTMALAVPVAWALMLPDQLENFGQSLVASVAMANNVLLYVTTGYWAQPAELKPLMHTWSLGIEEQFYLLLPPLMVLVLRRGSIRMLAIVLAGLAALSMAIAQIWSQHNPSAGFLMLPSRIWELAIGGLVALAQMHGMKASASAGWFGLAGTLIALALFREGTPAPSLVTLLPVGSCALFLLGSDSEHGAGRLLGWPPFVVGGLVSYSAYLFHQPIYAFLRLLSWEEPSPWNLAATIPLVFIAAWTSWRWIERPARDTSRVGGKAIILATGVAALILAGVGFTFHRTHGFAGRWAELYGPNGEPPGDFIAYVESAFRFVDAPLDPGRRDSNVLFVGDSYARDAANMVLVAGAKEQQLSIQVAVRCGPREIARSVDPAMRADTVIIAAIPKVGSIACYRKWVARLEAVGVRHVVMLGPKQFGYSTNRAFVLAPEVRRRMTIRPMRWAREADRAMSTILPARNFVSFFAIAADQSGGVPVVTAAGKIISQDGRHLTRAGAQWLGPRLFAQPVFAHLKLQS